MNGVTLLCYWGGKTCDGPDGVTYDKPPSKAIKVNREIRFDELIEPIYHATSIDKEEQQIKVMCRYPWVGVGKVIKYVLLPVKDNDDVDVIFDVLNFHQEVSALDLYLKVEDNAPIRHREMAFRNRESVVTEEERSNEYCLRHFVHNFYEKFRNSELKTLAYRAGSQNQVRKFNSTMDEIGKLNSNARQWLERHAFDRWTLAYDGGRRYGLLTTNLSEIFNSVLKGARFFTYTTSIQLTLYRLVHYFEVRLPLGSIAQSNEDVHTHILAKQVGLMSKSSAHSLRSFNREKGIFELITQGGKIMQVVDLEQKTCTCGKWEAFKYPCSHVFSVCAKLSLDSWQYVDRCYSIVEYCATWASEFFPLPHEAYWPQSSSL